MDTELNAVLPPQRAHVLRAAFLYGAGTDLPPGRTAQLTGADVASFTAAVRRARGEGRIRPVEAAAELVELRQMTEEVSQGRRPVAVIGEDQYQPVRPDADKKARRKMVKLSRKRNRPKRWKKRRR